jgi:hypothetical protein
MQIQIVQLERNLSDGTVTVIHWSATEQDGEHSARAYGSASLERNEDSATFIPFEDLTEEQVIQWVEAEWASLEDRNNGDSPEETLKAEVAKLKAPTSTTGMPWSQVAV